MEKLHFQVSLNLPFRFLTKVAVAHALLDIKEKYTKKDGRKLGDALKIAKTDLFDVSGRDEKHKILVVLSDGAAGDSFNEFSQALKDMAVSIYFVGNGDYQCSSIHCSTSINIRGGARNFPTGG